MDSFLLKKVVVLPKFINSNTFSSRHFLNRVRIMREYLRKKSRVNSFPTMAEIETTSLCNLRCIMCGRNYGKDAKEKKHMNFDLFKKIIDQCKGKMELAILHAGGEPLLHPNIFDMIEYTREAGIGSWLSSNATVLDESKSEKLLKSSLNGLVLSIDGVTAETYEKIRLGARFEVTKSNIIRFLDMHGRMNSDLLVTIQMIEMEENRHEVDEFVRYWSQFNANIIVKPLVNWDIRNVGDMLYPSIRCDRPWYWLFIRSTGLVPPCGHDFNMKAVFGDLNINSVEDVWNSSVAQQFRVSVKNGKKGHPICSRCDYAPAIKRGLPGNLAQTSLDMLTICKILFWTGYYKVDRKGL